MLNKRTSASSSSRGPPGPFDPGRGATDRDRNPDRLARQAWVLSRRHPPAGRRGGSGRALVAEAAEMLSRDRLWLGYLSPVRRPCSTRPNAAAFRSSRCPRDAVPRDHRLHESLSRLERLPRAQTQNHDRREPRRGDAASPEAALVVGSARLPVDASVFLYALNGRVATSAERRRGSHLAGARADRHGRASLSGVLVVAEPVLTGHEVRRWLTVATRRRGLSEELVGRRGPQRVASARVVDLAREAMRAGERTLRAEFSTSCSIPRAVRKSRGAPRGVSSSTRIGRRGSPFRVRGWRPRACGRVVWSETSRAASIIEAVATSRVPVPRRAARGRLASSFRRASATSRTDRPPGGTGSRLIAGVGRPSSRGGAARSTRCVTRS